MYAVILAGGSGSRFWPLSRELYPKQLLKLFGNATMIQQTIQRVNKVIEREKTMIVCNPRVEQDIRQQLGCLDRNDTRGLKVLLEPAARNTAAAIGLAAVTISEHDPKGVMAVFSSDHLIEGEGEFKETIREAEALAKDGYLVALGIRPTRAETGFGYIHAMGRPVGKAGRGLPIAEYIEKPDRVKAQALLNGNEFYWNCGIFLWRVDVFLSEMKIHLPDHYATLLMIRGSTGNETRNKKALAAYRRLPPVSIDYGMMEKTRKGVMVPASFRWNDVGCWSALDDVLPRDSSGNIMTGNVLDLGSTDSILHGCGRLLVTIGLNDCIVVDTEDATLVCPKSRAQDVRKAVDRLREREGEEHVVHRTIDRPWGFFTVLEKGRHFKIKKLTVNPGDRLSLQMHRHRSEHWVVISGTARVTLGDRVVHVRPNESIDIPILTRHRLENSGKVPLQIIEVQNGEYLEEDDIVRFDDAYGRVTADPAPSNTRRIAQRKKRPAKPHRATSSPARLRPSKTR